MVHCSMLQYAAVCCSVCVVSCNHSNDTISCSTIPDVAAKLEEVCCSVLQCIAVQCKVLQCVAVCCSVLQCVAVCVVEGYQAVYSVGVRCGELLCVAVCV